jgi:hypothetical protein
MLWEASPTPMPRSTSIRRDHFTPHRGRKPLPPTRQTKPVARQQHDRRRPNSDPPNEFSLLSPKTHQATHDTIRAGASRSPCAPDGVPINFWTFGPGRLRPEIQKSDLFFQPISSKHLEKQRLKRAATGGKRKDFWTALIGPPRRARQSKSPKRKLAATRQRSARRQDESNHKHPASSNSPRTNDDNRRDNGSPKRHLNFNGDNNLQFLSPKTHQGDTRRHAPARRRGREPFAIGGVPRQTSFPVAKDPDLLNVSTPTASANSQRPCRPKKLVGPPWPPRPPWPPWPTRKNQPMFIRPRPQFSIRANPRNSRSTPRISTPQKAQPASY